MRHTYESSLAMLSIAVDHKTRITMTRQPEFSQVLALIPQLHSYARRFCHNNSLLPEDLVQETLLKAWLRLRDGHEGRPIKNLSGWLHSALHNKACDMLRHSEIFSDDPDGTAIDSAQAPDYGAAEELTDMTQTAMTVLPAAHRQAFLLVVIHGFNYNEAAAKLGVPVGTVKSGVARARTIILQELGQLDGVRPRQAYSYGAGDAKR
jgi:RNA polymerase sigma-70 factor (ECF subfamily)